MKKSLELRKFTFPDSEKTIYLPPISIGVAAMKLRRRYKAPRPPLQVIEIPGSTPIREFNYGHPDYINALQQYNTFIDTMAGEMAFEQVYKFKLTAEQEAEVEAWKEENPDQWDADFDDDTALWLENIGVSSDNDLEALFEYIGGPSLERIEAIQDSFQD